MKIRILLGRLHRVSYIRTFLISLLTTSLYASKELHFNLIRLVMCLFIPQRHPISSQFSFAVIHLKTDMLKLKVDVKR